MLLTRVRSYRHCEPLGQPIKRDYLLFPLSQRGCRLRHLPAYAHDRYTTGGKFSALNMPEFWAVDRVGTISPVNDSNSFTIFAP